MPSWLANLNTCKRACSPFPCGLWSHLCATFCQSRFQLTLLMYSSRSGMACSAIPVAMSPAHPDAQSVAPTPIARRMRLAPPDSARDAHSRAIPGVIDDASLVLVLVKTPPLYASARREGLGEHPPVHESRLHPAPPVSTRAYCPPSLLLGATCPRGSLEGHALVEVTSHYVAAATW